MGFFLLLSACAPPKKRPYFNRDHGGYGYSSSLPRDIQAHRRPPDGLKPYVEPYLGTPYRFGGQNRNGMDCSGFIRQVFQEAYGMKLPHNSAQQFLIGKAVSVSGLQEGDLVFFQRFYGINHAGIYMGEGRFIHASVGKGVTYDRLDAPYYRKRYAGAKRLAPGP